MILKGEETEISSYQPTRARIFSGTTIVAKRCHYRPRSFFLLRFAIFIMLSCSILLLLIKTVLAFSPMTALHRHSLDSTGSSAVRTMLASSSLRKRQQRRGRLHLSAQNGEDATEDNTILDADDSVVYFSPNVPLEQSRHHSKGDGDLASSGTINSERSSSVNEYSFFDEAIIYVRSGSGGQGASTYKQIGNSRTRGPPDGGNGGVGGNVYLQMDDSLNTLAGLSNAWRPNFAGGSGRAATTAAARPKSFRAENGKDGSYSFRTGKNGKDVVIAVPPGTTVQEQILDSDNNVIKLVELGKLVALDKNEDDDNLGFMGEKDATKGSSAKSMMLVAQGGQGGEGSAVTGKRGSKTARPRLSPVGGERKLLKLTLQVVADVAIVGVPSAGKSTLLASVTRAKPKIANYPFTTVIPNLGVWIPPESSALSSPATANYDRRGDNKGNQESNNDTGTTTATASEGLVLCDVPGLIAGAASGVGLGHAFLRHVERCHVILHVLDATSNNVIADYQMLNQELCNYGSGALANMPQVVVVNKLDLLEQRLHDEWQDNGQDQNQKLVGGNDSEEWEQGLQTRWTRQELQEQLTSTLPHKRLLWMSAKQRDGVDDLMTRLAAFVKKVKQASKPETT